MAVLLLILFGPVILVLFIPFMVGCILGDFYNVGNQVFRCRYRSTCGLVGKLILFVIGFIIGCILTPIVIPLGLLVLIGVALFWTIYAVCFWTGKLIRSCRKRYIKRQREK